MRLCILSHLCPDQKDTTVSAAILLAGFQVGKLCSELAKLVSASCVTR